MYKACITAYGKGIVIVTSSVQELFAFMFRHPDTYFVTKDDFVLGICDSRD